MIVLIVPEPSWWVAPLTLSLRRHDSMRVFAPWALSRVSPRWLPARARASWTRRQIAPDATSLQPAWMGVEAALASWAGKRTDRLMAARYARRRATDGMAAWWLDHLGSDISLVVAPSLAARRTFAAAAARGLPRLLVQDLPGLRGLHDDLDRAARRWPDSHLLRRYRAPAALVARQEAEQVLADLVVVGGRFAEQQLRARGLGPERIAGLPPDDKRRSTLAGDPLTLALSPEDGGEGTGEREISARQIFPDRAGPQILLAGAAAARNGVFEAFAATRMIAGATLLVRAGDGAETAGLIGDPQLRWSTAQERETLSGVDLVLAPAWCESYPPEVPRAARLGLPVVASGRAAGAVDLARAGAEVAPGDVAAMARAIQDLWRKPRAPFPDDRAFSWPSLDAALGRLFAGPATDAPPVHGRRLPVLS